MSRLWCVMVVGNLAGILVLFLIRGLDGLKLGALNFECAFLGFLLIVSASLKSLQKNVQNQIHDLEALEPKERKKQRFSHWILGIRISAGLWRILAYVLFCLILYGLMSRHIFDFISFNAGLFFALFSLLVMLVLHWRKAEKAE